MERLEKFACSFCMRGSFRQDYPFEVIVKGAPEKILDVCGEHAASSSLQSSLSHLAANNSTLLSISRLLAHSHSALQSCSACEAICMTGLVGSCVARESSSAPGACVCLGWHSAGCLLQKCLTIKTFKALLGNSPALVP